MRKALTRTAAVLAATAAPLCIAAAAPASAAPTGPVTLNASASPDGASIELTYFSPFATPSTCTSRVQGVGAGGETIVTQSLANTGSTSVTVSPKTANLYAITYSCSTLLVGPSSSNGSPLFVNVDGGLPVATGTPGPQGPAGPAGPQGPAGTNGTNGTDGATGQQGPAGTNGTNGNDGATGPQGPKGDTGPQGPAGPIGGRTPFGS